MSRARGHPTTTRGGGGSQAELHAMPFPPPPRRGAGGRGRPRRPARAREDRGPANLQRRRPGKQHKGEGRAGAASNHKGKRRGGAGRSGACARTSRPPSLPAVASPRSCSSPAAALSAQASRAPLGRGRAWSAVSSRAEETRPLWRACRACAPPSVRPPPSRARLSPRPPHLWALGWAASRGLAPNPGRAAARASLLRDTERRRRRGEGGEKEAAGRAQLRGSLTPRWKRACVRGENVEEKHHAGGRKKRASERRLLSPSPPPAGADPGACARPPEQQQQQQQERLWPRPRGLARHCARALRSAWPGRLRESGGGPSLTVEALLLLRKA